MKPRRLQDKALLKAIRALPCCVCGSSPVDAAHVISKGAGGPDSAFNLLSLCRYHHQIQHQIGFKRMAEEFPSFAQELSDKGWTFNEFGKLKNDKLQKETA